MLDQSFAIIALLVVVYTVVSRRLERTVLTPPMLFLAFGMIACPSVLGLLELDPESEFIHLVTELTLVLVLFTDAARIDLKSLRADFHVPLRLLGFGMPLTILFGGAAALFVFPEFSIWEAFVLAAILAPTDAALGQAVVNNPKVPVRIRQALNVESGLNDGVALPVVLFFAFLAGASGGPGGETTYWIAFVAEQLIFGAAIGATVGYLGGKLVNRAERAGWMDHPSYKLCAVAIAVFAFGGAEFIGGNGFISAFCAGLLIGNTARDSCGCLYDFAETEGNLLALLAFLFFGTLMVWPALLAADGAVFLYAVLSLSLIRMAPVLLSLIGLHLKPPTWLFLGWFGPRGLASILFGLHVLGEMQIPHHNEIFSVMVVTVFFSAVAHGMTALPAALRYGAYIERTGAEAMVPEHIAVAHHPLGRAASKLSD